AAAAGRGAEALFLHPNVREVVFATASEMVAAGAKGMNSEAYGFIDIKVFHALDEALAYVNGG
ncbi:MAG: hypothetical protein GYB65_12595, partial [Chloroflexi bacterium]|nr:hypothetical protein [Chloroflexota bacterium]